MNSGAVSVRKMVSSDLDRVIEIADSLTTAPQWERAVYAAAIEPDAEPRRIVLVAEIGGEVAGFVVCVLIADTAEIESIVVSGKAQRRGVGRALLARLIGDLQTAGAKALQLEVRESNGSAIGLYERMGFRETGRRRGYYLVPVEDALIFVYEVAYPK